MYKFRLISSGCIMKCLEKKADELKKDIILIDETHSRIVEKFEQLKNIKPKLTRLAVQVAKLKQEKPVLQDLYKKNQQEICKIEDVLSVDIEKLLLLLSRAIKLMKAIIFDADTMIYREDKKLTNLIKKIKTLKNKDITNKLVFKLNTVKAEMKSMSLKLLQASELEEEEVLKYPAVETAIPVPKYIKGLGKQISELEKEKTGLKKIDAVLRNSEAKLRNLQGIEMRIIALMSSVDRYLDYLRNRTYLLEKRIRAGIDKRTANTIKDFNTVKKDIRKQALMLYKEIRMIGEKNKKRK